MSDLALLIFLVLAQGVPGGILAAHIIWEVFKMVRAEWQTVPTTVIMDQGAALAALAALEDRRAAATTPAARRPEELPYFPYAAAKGRESETLCAICVEPLQQGQHCSEVPACRHAFHRDCLGVWARTKATCPLCRAKIVAGSDGVAAAEDMV